LEERKLKFDVSDSAKADLDLEARGYLAEWRATRGGILALF